MSKPIPREKRAELIKDMEFNKKYAWIKVALMEGKYVLDHTVGENGAAVFVYRLLVNRHKSHFFKTNIALHQ